MTNDMSDVLAHSRALRTDARRNHAKLLVAASAIFAAAGPDAALEEIARRAGVGIGTLYRHFPTREALMGAVVREHILELTDDAQEALAAADPFEALAGWLRAHLAFSATKRGLVAGIVMLKQTGDSDFAAACDRMIAALEALVARAQAAGQVRAEVTARDVMHLIGAIAAGAERAADPEMAGRLLEVTLAGLRTGPGCAH